MTNRQSEQTIPTSNQAEPPSEQEIRSLDRLAAISEGIRLIAERLGRPSEEGSTLFQQFERTQSLLEETHRRLGTNVEQVTVFQQLERIRDIVEESNRQGTETTESNTQRTEASP